MAKAKEDPTHSFQLLQPPCLVLPVPLGLPRSTRSHSGVPRRRLLQRSGKAARPVTRTHLKVKLSPDQNFSTVQYLNPIAIDNRSFKDSKRGAPIGWLLFFLRMAWIQKQPMWEGDGKAADGCEHNLKRRNVLSNRSLQELSHFLIARKPLPSFSAAADSPKPSSSHAAALVGSVRVLRSFRSPLPRSAPAACRARAARAPSPRRGWLGSRRHTATAGDSLACRGGPRCESCGRCERKNQG